jgi:hypothetical protein
MHNKKFLSFFFLSFFLTAKPVGNPDITVLKNVVRSEVQQAIKEEKEYTFIKNCLFYCTVVAGAFLLFRKFGWATTRDVKRELQDGTQTDMNRMLNSLNNNLNANYSQINIEVNTEHAAIKAFLDELTAMEHDNGLTQEKRNAALQKLSELQEKLLTGLDAKREDAIILYNQVRQKYQQLVEGVDKLTPLIAQQQLMSKILKDQMENANSVLDQLIEQLNMETNISSQTTLDDFVINKIQKISLVCEDTKAWQQLGNTDEYLKGIALLKLYTKANGDSQQFILQVEQQLNIAEQRVSAIEKNAFQKQPVNLFSITGNAHSLLPSPI